MFVVNFIDMQESDSWHFSSKKKKPVCFEYMGDHTHVLKLDISCTEYLCRTRRKQLRDLNLTSSSVWFNIRATHKFLFMIDVLHKMFPFTDVTKGCFEQHRSTFWMYVKYNLETYATGHFGSIIITTLLCEKYGSVFYGRLLIIFTWQYDKGYSWLLQVQHVNVSTNGKIWLLISGEQALCDGYLWWPFV